MWQDRVVSPLLLHRLHYLCAGAQRGSGWEEGYEEVKIDRPTNSSDMRVMADPRLLLRKHGQKEANRELWTPQTRKTDSAHESSKTGDRSLDDDRLGMTRVNYENFSKMSETSRTGAGPLSVTVFVFQVSMQGRWPSIGRCSSFEMLCNSQSYAYFPNIRGQSRVTN